MCNLPLYGERQYSFDDKTDILKTKYVLAGFISQVPHLFPEYDLSSLDLHD